MCPHTAAIYMCLHTALYLSSYYCMCLHTVMYVSSYYCMCVSSFHSYYYMCLVCVTRTYYCMCPHSTYTSVALVLVLYMCPHITACYVCVLIPLILVHMCPHTTRWRMLTYAEVCSYYLRALAPRSMCRRCSQVVGAYVSIRQHTSA
jgi:hypothetical protein